MSESDELEGVQVDAGEPESTETQDPVEGSELAPDTAPEQDKKPDGEDKPRLSPEAQERVNKAIGKQYSKRMKAEEEAAAARREAEELRQKLAQAQGADGPPEVPSIPDQYDEDYEAKLLARDEAIKRRAAWEREQELLYTQQKQAAQEVQRKQQEEFVEKANVYADRIQKLSLNGETVYKATEAIAPYVPQDFADALLVDLDGPLIAQALAEDFALLERWVTSSPIQAGSILETEIRPKAQALRPKTSDAPPPAETLGGGGVAVDDLGGHKVTIE